MNVSRAHTQIAGVGFDSPPTNDNITGLALHLGISSMLNTHNLCSVTTCLFERHTFAIMTKPLPTLGGPAQ